MDTSDSPKAGPASAAERDISERLDELAAVIESARAMPMSASCIINRAEVLETIEELRAALPDELTLAQGVIEDRSAVLEEGRLEAEKIINDAEVESRRLVSRTEVVKEAAKEADRIVEAAQTEADQMRMDVDDYVDAKLANFEIILRKTLAAVEHGRDKIQGRHAELEALADTDEQFEPLPG